MIFGDGKLALAKHKKNRVCHTRMTVDHGRLGSPFELLPSHLLCFECKFLGEE